MTRRAVILSATLFVLAFGIFAASSVKTSYDSRWSLHTAMSLIRGHGGALTAYMPLLASNNFYAIEYCGGAPRTLFPVGVSVLAVPAVLTMMLVSPGFEASLADAVPDSLEKLIASFYGALAVALFFLLVNNRFRSFTLAAATAMVFALGTSMWSVGTRALWQHGPLMLMFVIAMLLLERARARPALAQYIGLPLAAAFVIRPMAAVPIAVLGLYLLVRDRGTIFLKFALWSGVVMVPWIAYNMVTCGAIYPAYYDPFRASGTQVFWEALIGNMASPGRGLFIYSPVMVFAMAGFVIALRRAEDRALAIAYGIIVILHWIAVSRFPHWWVGHTYGPRMMSDVLPFIVWFLPFSLEAIGRLRGFVRGALVGAFVVLAAVSIAIHAQGATRSHGYAWNVLPTDVDRTPARLWDWHDPPFLR